MAVVAVGLVVLAMATFFPSVGLPSRRRREHAPHQLIDLADRLSPYAVTRPPIIDLAEAERSAPATKKATAKKTGARKATPTKAV